jgi:hypothetical protein
MRHRQTTGAGLTGARPSIIVLLLTAAGGGLTVGFGQPDGVWAGYGAASAAALIGCGSLWQQRGLMERYVKETARRRRAELEESEVVAQRHQTALERARLELENEQQYSALIQDQFSRAREQLDKERAARQAAERELDTLTGAAGWQSGRPNLVLTVEEPFDQHAADDSPRTASPQTALPPASLGPRLSGFGSSVPPAFPASPKSGMSAAQRRGWQIVDGDGEDDADAIESGDGDLIYSPFIDQLATATVPLSDAALAMAPVIGAVDLDGVLDLTAYDETIEMSVRDIKRMA